MSRIGIVTTWQTTTTYSPRRTSLPDCEAFEQLAGPAIIDGHGGKGTVPAAIARDDALLKSGEKPPQ